jgi:hypothetical protein
MEAAKFGHDSPAHLVVNINGRFPAPRIADKMVLINSPKQRVGHFDGCKLSALKSVKFIFEIFCRDRLGHKVPARDNLRASSPG